MEAEETGKPAEETSWLDKCPVCKARVLSQITEKRRFGLGTKEKAVCGCGAVFEARGDGYELKTGGDYSSPTWQEYGRHVLSPREWTNIAHGGMSDARQRDDDIATSLAAVRDGTLGITVIGAEPPIILKKGEELRLVLPGVRLLEPRAVRRGSYGGGSIRIAKGVRISTGGFQAESREELRQIDQGTLTLTNKRFVFTGGKRTISVGLAQIVSVEGYRHGIALNRTRKQKTEYFTNLPKAEVRFTVDERTYEEPFNPPLLADIITGLVAQLD